MPLVSVVLVTIEDDGGRIAGGTSYDGTSPPQLTRTSAHPLTSTKPSHERKLRARAMKVSRTNVANDDLSSSDFVASLDHARQRNPVPARRAPSRRRFSPSSSQNAAVDGQPRPRRRCATSSSSDPGDRRRA